MEQIESLSKQNQVLFDENITLQDRLLQMNSVLQTSVSSIHQDSVDGRQQNKKSGKKRGDAADRGGSDDSDEELSRELRENQAQGIIVELSSLLMQRFDVLK